jgi:hypothetical protein
VLPTIAISSSCSFDGTLNLSRVLRKSATIACHCAFVDVQVLVRLFHRPAAELAWATGDFADERRHVELEPRLRYAFARVVDRGIRVERVIDEQPLDEVVDNRGDAVNAAESIVERARAYSGSTPTRTTTATAR